MGTNRYAQVSGIVFAGIAAAHVLRAALQVPAQLGSYQVPLWISWVAVAVTGSLSLWAFRSSRGTTR
jgi:hypothetical protein